MKRLIIATGIYPPQIGGPALYAQHLATEFKALGGEVQVVTYGQLERFLPFGLRQLSYFLKLWRAVGPGDQVLALDAFSVALPVAWLRCLKRIKVIIRIGGDFLWESYVERTGKLIPLSHFYQTKLSITFKERIIFKLTRWLLARADGLAFTTDWQRQIWQTP